ncbi:aspartate aminotransferase family protein [Ferrimonas marina]|uniref:Beta-alanine--pyruvate transaminase n=1 Tax=Ferrimonas marina TaxID=299255 RepID=A0A1M5MN52_9GAMM|nr:aspartate aminotransferase family protein [Ferrimonas marina]SHG78738.1 beta-alanine--pyruvate transaminase [Ferrimonas marina]
MQQEQLSAYWMPFTANRQFKQAPRLIAKAQGMHYYDSQDRPILDGTAGLWCCNAGHNRTAIVEAIQQQAATLDYAPSFQMGHLGAFEAAQALVSIAPEGLTRAFFANSGSEAVDSALKIALAYQRAKGEPSRTRLIGRELGYHGVGFGGISVGGLVNNRRGFGHGLSGVDHLSHNKGHAGRFVKGQASEGAERADDLLAQIQLHGAENIAAVIVEPVQGSAGVIVPPQGYLQRLRQICDEHGIVLIFDEVITGFGRIGAPFAAQRFGVTPDMITCAKGLTSGTVPMGAVLVNDAIHDTLVQGPEGQIELFHGYTYSGHPLAAAAAKASLALYQDEALFDHAREMEGYWQEALHSLRDLDSGIVDIRNFGLMGAVEFAPEGGRRAYAVFEHAFHKEDLLLRASGDFLVMSPPLILQRSDVDAIIERLSRAIHAQR